MRWVLPIFSFEKWFIRQSCIDVYEGVRGRMSYEELTPEYVEKLLEKATDLEKKFLLVLWTQNRPGSSFSEHEAFEVLYGEVEDVELEHEYNYPHRNATKHLIIPKAVPTVIRWWRRWDFGVNDMGEEQEIYVFTRDGWKVVEV
jgi:hypothetical protein